MIDENEEFIKEEIHEVTRGNVARVSAAVTVGVLREILRTADSLGVTGIEFTDTGQPLPLRVSVRQLRPIIEEQLRTARDVDKIDFGMAPFPGQTLH